MKDAQRRWRAHPRTLFGEDEPAEHAGWWSPGELSEEVAGFLGNTVAMVEKVYAHHHPDYLRKAADALVGVDNSKSSSIGREMPLWRSPET
ncbi:hypothetical protein [Roseomonas elaeocarpi]|uniref:Integrase n=1 Tax=Roseomonas elaeocarpi TaxID=907779 RepID=A0ABV6JQV3_9PROT